MSKLWKILVVLVLGVTVDVPAPKTGDGWGFGFTGPGLGIVLYSILLAVALTSVLNHLPGIFAIRRPLGVVRSGYEYLWIPAIVAGLFGFVYRGVIEGRDFESDRWTLSYGAGHDSFEPLVALIVFAMLMWVLKLRATMIEANGRLGAS